MKTKQWSVEVYISEDGPETHARVVLFSGGEEHATGDGRARRNPVDPEVAEIGDELAVARALADLAGRLHGAADKDIARLPGSG
ncbi:DUF1876 domain-containing protein [Actinomadura latina]|uniref:DUF1876 domain-containing protein n=1 Tax=Actinomadura latina TaxID=163603 RepID=A0A846Z056_9ACTN|nr:DUF1876 domain-containing protein [Actinomadura latina]NKZ03763.1 DUF1876 domain-containing protein [Actinomadura latina]